MELQSTSAASVGHPSPIVQSSKTKLFRTSGLESKSAQVKLHKEQVLLRKELDRLERQAHTAFNNVDNNKQSIKMIQRKIEKRAQDNIAAKSLTSFDRRHTVSGEKTTLLHNRTIVTMPSSSEMFRPRTYSHFGEPSSTESRVVDGGTQHNEASQPVLSSRSPYNSPYISSPALYLRRSNLPKSFQSPSRLVSHDDKKTGRPNGHEASLLPPTKPPDHDTASPTGTATHLPRPSTTLPTATTTKPSNVVFQVEHDLKLPEVSSSPSLQLKARPGTASKKKLKRVDLDGLGLDTAGHSQPDFEHFYKTKTPYLSAVFDSSIDDDDDDDVSRDPDGKSKTDLEELAAQQTLEELYGEIKNCRYIRLYEPRYGQRGKQHQKKRSVKARQSS